MQDEVASRTAEGRAGGGMVTAVVNGRLEVLRVHIDPSLLESPDREMLQDLVVAAVNDALRAARTLIADEMQKVTGRLADSRVAAEGGAWRRPPSMTRLIQQLTRLARHRREDGLPTGVSHPAQRARVRASRWPRR